MTSLPAMSLIALTRLACSPTVRFAPGARWPDQAVFFANHTSHLDFIVIWSVLSGRLQERTRPVAARDYWSKGMVKPRLASDVFHAVLVERASTSVATLRRELTQLIDVLDAGQSLIIFPEGTRGTGPSVAPFRGGIDFLARSRPDVDFVPVHLDRLQRIMPKGEFLPVPQLSTVTFGPAIRRPPGETTDVFLARAREAVVGLRPT